MRSYLVTILSVLFLPLATGWACEFETVVDAPRPFPSSNLRKETPHRPKEIASLFDESHLNGMEQFCSHQGLDLFPGIEYLNKDNVTRGITLFKEDWNRLLERADSDPALAKKLDSLLLSYLKAPPVQGTAGEYRYLPGMNEKTALTFRRTLDQTFQDVNNVGYFRAVMLNLEQSADGAEHLAGLSRNATPDRQAIIITRSRAAHMISSLIKRRLPEGQRHRLFSSNENRLN